MAILHKVHRETTVLQSCCLATIQTDLLQQDLINLQINFLLRAISMQVSHQRGLIYSPTVRHSLNTAARSLERATGVRGRREVEAIRVRST